MTDDEIAAIVFLIITACNGDGATVSIVADKLRQFAWLASNRT